MSRLNPAPSDARAFTSYMSAGQQEDFMRRTFGLSNENEYRQFLQDNASLVASETRQMHTHRPPVAYPPVDQSLDQSTG